MSRVVIVGSGMIGSFLGGKLQTAKVKVTFLGRPWLKTMLHKAGFMVLSSFSTDVQDKLAYNELDIRTEFEDLQRPNEPLPSIFILTVKNQAISSATLDFNKFIAKHYTENNLPNLVILQNGVKAKAEVLNNLENEKMKLKVTAGFCSFNVQSTFDGNFHQGTSGPVVFENNVDPALPKFLESSSTLVKVLDNTELVAYQRGKLILNLNNAVNALTGLTLKNQFFESYSRWVVADAYTEAINILDKAGLSYSNPLSKIPLGYVPKLMRTPDFLFSLLFGNVVTMDEKATSSMQDDFIKGRKTEIEFLNGYIVKLGQEYDIPAPVNSLLCKLVREAEEKNEGCPNISPLSLYNSVQDAKANNQ